MLQFIIKLLFTSLVLVHFSFTPCNVCSDNESSVPATKEWKLIKNKQGIRIYARSYKNTKHRELKAIGVFRTSLSCLVAIIKDDTAVPDWINRMKTFKNIKVISDFEWYTYAEISLPFPYYNRDLISLNTLKQNKNGIVTISIKSKPTYLPERKKKVRMKNAEGHWRFKPLGDGRVLVSYQFYAEPNLGLPSWIMNPLATKGVLNTLKSFRKMADKTKYQKADLSYIR